MTTKVELSQEDKGIAGSALMTSAKTGSGSDCHGTPQWLYDFLDREFGPFDLDPCADEFNSKCSRFFTQADDGLKQTWTGKVFANPPYSALKAWVTKAHESVFIDQSAARVVMLIPARTDTGVWHSVVTKGLVFLLKGRLVFAQPEDTLRTATAKWFAKRKRLPTPEESNKRYEIIKRTGAPFPSAVVVFDRNIAQQTQSAIGTTMSVVAVNWNAKNTLEQI